MNQAILCDAIAAQNLVSFYYTGDKSAGRRLVEPHMVAYTTTDSLVLSAWFLGGASESQEGQGWREYFLACMSEVTILPQKFSGSRPGYNPSGGTKLHSVQCGL
jgi:hypothetical protein